MSDWEMSTTSIGELPFWEGKNNYLTEEVKFWIEKLRLSKIGKDFPETNQVE